MKDVDAAWINELDLQAGVHRSGMNADCPVSGERHENLLNAVHRALPGLRRIARDAEGAEKFPICGVDILRRVNAIRLIEFYASPEIAIGNAGCRDRFRGSSGLGWPGFR